MVRYALRRLLGMIPTLLVIVTAAFFVMRLAPGGPFDEEQTIPPEIQANLEAAYGLDQPVHRAVRALSRRALLHGDLGPSFKYKDYRVTELIARGLPVTLTIGVLALLLAVGARRAARHAGGAAARRSRRPRGDVGRAASASRCRTSCSHRCSRWFSASSWLVAGRRVGAGQRAPPGAARRDARVAVRRLHRAADARQPARGAAGAVPAHRTGQRALARRAAAPPCAEADRCCRW